MSKPWIAVIPDGSADEDLQALYDDNRGPQGCVDNILAIHSLDPESMRAHLGVYRNSMAARCGLSRRQREMIAVVVSCANRCHY